MASIANDERPTEAPWPGPFPDLCKSCQGERGDDHDRSCPDCAGTGVSREVYVRSIPGPRCDLDGLAANEYVRANVANNCWDVFSEVGR